MRKKKRAFLICSVRKADGEAIEIQEAYVDHFERERDFMHWPHRDTEQRDPEGGMNICKTTFWAIFRADEVHVMFDPVSEGFRFDLGLVFALAELHNRFRYFRWLFRRKRVILANPLVVHEELDREEKGGIRKSYTRVLWYLAVSSV